MNQKIRFSFGIFVARLVRRSLLILGRKATHYPGVLALRICPNFLNYIERPTHLIGVTGTNGKTTVSNMLIDVLKSQGFKVANNSYGSNIVPGVITAFLDSTTFFGRNKVEWGVIEIDERASSHILKYLIPDVLVVTNLFRDSYKRNAHIEFIVDILNKNIPEKTHLVVNGDDLFASNLAPNNSRTIFGILKQEHELERRDSIINDGIYCPRCHKVLTYDFVRYHHIGRFHCENCGFTSAVLDVVVETIESDHVEMKLKEKPLKISFNSNNITDVYNLLPVVTVFDYFGFKQIESLVSHCSVVSTRFRTSKINNREVVRLLAKDQNSVANSRIFDMIAQKTSLKSVALLFMNEENAHVKNPPSPENMAWLFDADFEYLNQEFIKQIIIGGHRRYDYKVRCLMANIEESKIIVVDNEEEELDKIDSSIESVILIHSTKNIDVAIEFEQQLINRLKQEAVYENRISLF